MDSSVILRLLFVLFYIENISSVNIFNVDQKYPQHKSEIEVCGNIRDVIKSNSARFLKILVRNTNSEIAFQNDDARRMTARAKSKLDVLASRVQARWGGKKVKVLKAWTDVVVANSISLQYEGRAFQLQVSDNDNSKLGELAALAVEAGFDWVHYTRNNYIHASVIRDVCQTAVDLAFILDASGSVGPKNFEGVKSFVKKVVDFFNIGPDGTHVAVVKYQYWSYVEFHLNAYTTKSALKRAVNSIHYTGGSAYTGIAIDMTRTQVFTKANGMRPDKGIPKVAVLLTDGRAHDYPAVAADKIKKIGVNMFCIGIGNINQQELKDIASDPDSDHVFTLSNFNALSSWVDKLSAVSCDEGASVSACDDTISKVDGGSFLYFRTEFVSATGGISVEVKDTRGTSHLYVSLTSKNPGPMDPNLLKNENNASPRSLRLKFPSHRAKQLVFVAVQGQENINEFKLSMWDTLFSRDNFVVYTDEEQNAPQYVTKVKSSVNQYRLEYSFTDTSNGPFKIDSSSGRITTTGRLDHETKARYDLTVLAKDKDNACHKGRTVVTVHVKDINDNKPKFKYNKYDAKVYENRPRDSSVALMMASDDDSTAVLQYSLVNGFGKFQIDKPTGKVTTTSVLDYEQQNQYILQITVTDGRYSASTSLVVSVLNVNERPVFNNLCVANGRCTFNVAENTTATVNKQIADFAATDPDRGTVTYTLKILDSQDKAFSIDSTGKIILLKKLDRETKSMYNLLVIASDQGRPVLSVEVEVAIVVTDINDNPPVFPVDKYVGSVYENSNIRRQVIQVQAQDADAGSNSKITYTIHSGDTNSFTIDSSRGIISTRRVLDREAKSSYQLTVRAADSGGLYDETSVTVNVLDANDHEPVCSKKVYNENASEDAALGSDIGQVTATDKDTGINADLMRYNILYGNIGNTFNLDSKTGKLTLHAALDYEQWKSYSLSIKVSDRGSPALYSICTMVVTVIDVNDNDPIFQSRVYQATVKELSTKGTTVVKVSATDIDSGVNGKVEYFITNGNSYTTFTINQDTGLISVNNPPVFNTRSQYGLTIEARDQGQPIKKATVHTMITIEDVNDHTPEFDSPTYNAKVKGNDSKGFVVITLTAGDGDTGPRGRVMYSIVGGNSENKFTIDSSTGAIKLYSSLDRETTATYNLTIEARDGGIPSKSSTCKVFIDVLDINDNSPVFNGPYTLHIAENKAVGTLVGEVIATDPDYSNNGKVTYIGTTGTFTVDPNTGKITNSKLLDYETQSVYSLSITAKDDGAQPRQETTVVKVIVDDVNDNPPKFPKDMYNCTVAENMARGAGVCYVTAVDIDSGVNAKLKYSLTGGSNKFTINSDTGEITTTKPLDREANGSYHLVVTVKDGQTFLRSAGFSDSVDVYVTIGDENDNQPIYHGVPFKFNVSETAIVGTNVGKVSASDADIRVFLNLLFFTGLCISEVLT